MTACTDNARNANSAPAPRPGNFPVVEPFALDQAGSKLSVLFELPDARDDGMLRPVFIGFRAIDRAGNEDGTFRNAQTVMDYLHEAAIPVRLRVWRVDDDGQQPVVLSAGHWDIQAKRASWEPHPGEVFTCHPPASTDNRPLIDTGLFDFDSVYYVHEFARIIPPTPGRYRLEIESLESHPVLLEQKLHLSRLRYELLVSHYRHLGIR